MTVSRDDPTLDELLRDPVTRAVMQADGVDPSALAAMLRALAPTIGRAAGRPAETPRCLARVRNMHAQLCGAR